MILVKAIHPNKARKVIKVAKVLSVIDSISEWVGKASSLLIFAIIAVILFEVLMRYFLHESQSWAAETSEFLFGYLFILGGAYCYLHDGHVRMDVIYGRFSPKGKAIVDAVTVLFIFIFCGVLVYKGWTTGWNSFLIRERSGSAWGPPVYPIKLLIPVGSGILMLQCIAKFIRDLSVAIGRAKS